MSGRWERALKARQRMGRALDTGPIKAVTSSTAIDVPVVHRPESVVWTESGDGERRAWHVAGDGSLHETPESRVWSVERAAERAAGGQG